MAAWYQVPRRRRPIRPLSSTLTGWERQYPRSKLEALLRLPPPVLGTGPLKVQFDFRPNARASIPYLAQGRVPTPQFAGLPPGQAGLYQINVQVPAAVPPIPACTVLFSCINSLIGCVIQSNTTINIAGISSFDGAAICVQPPQSAVNVAKMPMFARRGYYAR